MIAVLSTSRGLGNPVRFLCRLGYHRPSSRSQLDLRDQQVKTYCRGCGEVLVRDGDKWQVQGQTAEQA